MKRYSLAVIALSVFSAAQLPALAISSANELSSAQSYGAPFELYIVDMALDSNQRLLIFSSLKMLPNRTTLPIRLRSETAAASRTRADSAVELSKPSYDLKKVIALNNEGVQLLHTGNYAAAIDRFERALRLDPDYELARDNLAIAYNNYGLTLRNRPTEALKQFHRAYFINPSNLTTVQNLDGVIRMMGKDPKSAVVRKALAEKSMADGDYVSAFVEFQESKLSKEFLINTYKKIPRNQQLWTKSTFDGITGSVISPSGSSSKKQEIMLATDVDFGPYMADLQRRIKRCWIPPKEFESKRIVVVFKVHSDGNTSDVRLTESSGAEEADTAALLAIKNASPLRPLPDGAAAVVDVQFTFDYNVFATQPSFKYISRTSYREVDPVFSAGHESGRIYSGSVTRGFDFNYKPFRDSLEVQIKKAWLPPPGAENNQVVITFAVDRLGNISDAELYKPSGVSGADKAALNAVLKAGVVKPPPNGAGPKVFVEFTFGSKLAQLKAPG